MVKCADITIMEQRRPALRKEAAGEIWKGTRDMKYELTPDLETGNALIDSEHRQLFAAINNLMDACSKGEGRTALNGTVNFLNDYVKKHFGDEEDLQKKSSYPGYPAHKQFHDTYRQQLLTASQKIASEGAGIQNVAELNQLAGVLVSHIRREDKKLAAHLKQNG